MTTFEVRINISQVHFTETSTEIEDIQISNSKQSSIQSASFTIYDKNSTYYSVVGLGDSVQIKINNDYEFDGFISSYTIRREGIYILNIDCTGSTFELSRYNTDIGKTYTSQKTGYIAKDLIDTYGNGMSSENISADDGVTVASIVFDGETLMTCFQRLIAFDGYSFYVGRGVA